MFLSFVPWIKIIIGIIALFAGFYFLRDFFINMKLKGNFVIEDITNPQLVFPEVDLCIMFKILDIIDKKEK
jgi:hypothetical protein